MLNKTYQSAKYNKKNNTFCDLSRTRFFTCKETSILLSDVLDFLYSFQDENISFSNLSVKVSNKSDMLNRSNKAGDLFMFVTVFYTEHAFPLCCYE